MTMLLIANINTAFFGHSYWDTGTLFLLGASIWPAFDAGDAGLPVKTVCAKGHKLSAKYLLW